MTITMADTNTILVTGTHCVVRVIKRQGAWVPIIDMVSGPGAGAITSQHLADVSDTLAVMKTALEIAKAGDVIAYAASLGLRPAPERPWPT